MTFARDKSPLHEAAAEASAVPHGAASEPVDAFAEMPAAEKLAEALAAEAFDTLYVCGINHERAELGVREQFAMNAQRCRETLDLIRSQKLAREALVLSTCNRTEIYAFHPLQTGFGPRLREFFLSRAGSEGAGEHEAEHHTVPLYNYEGLEATRHFFAVCAGLNSMILGENEIKSQVRDATEISIDAGMSGPHLHRLIEGANRTAKRIKTETDLNTGTLSFGKASVLRAEEVLGTLEGKFCIVIGAGKVGRVAAETIARLTPAKLVILNRTLERAWDVAHGLDAEVAPIHQMPALMRRADLVIGAAFAPNFLVTRGMFEASRKSGAEGRKVCLVDAAVPRILDSSIGNLPGVTLLDIGDLEGIVAANREKRLRASQHAWEIVEEEMEKFHGRVKSAGLGPIIGRLRGRFDDVFSEAVNEASAMYGAAMDERHEVFLHRIKKRLLHEAIAEIKRMHKDLG